MKRNLLIIFAAIVTVLAFVSATYAQDVTEEPTLEPTAEVTEEAPIIVIGEDDLAPVIDEYAGDLKDALKFASPVLALAVFLVSVLGKFVFPDTVISTEKLVGMITAVAAGIYGLAEFLGAVPELMDGVSVLNELAGPALQIGIIIFVPSGLYYLARKWNTPVLSAKQGDKAFSLEPTRTNAAG
jgi:hypothetical protein